MSASPRPQRPIRVLDDIRHILQPDRQPQQVVGDAEVALAIRERASGLTYADLGPQ